MKSLVTWNGSKDWRSGPLACSRKRGTVSLKQSRTGIGAVWLKFFSSVLKAMETIWRPIIGPFPLLNVSINCFRLLSALPSLFFLLSFLSFCCPSFFSSLLIENSPPPQQSFHPLYKYLVSITLTSQAFLGSVFRSEHRGITFLTAVDGGRGRQATSK